MNHDQSPVRSALFVPASRPERIAKARASGADAVIVDLEDALPPRHKDSARRALAEALTDDPGGVPLWVRVNAAGSPWFDDDLALCARQPAIHGVMLPKAERHTDLVKVATLGKPLWALVESAAGVLALPELTATRGLERLAFGALDSALDLSLEDGSEGATTVLDQLRVQILLHSRARGLAPPLESVVAEFRDPRPLRRRANLAAQMGFGGMLCIHPTQIPPVHAAFAIDEARRDWARRVLQAAEQQPPPFQLEGEMIDEPVIRRAHRWLGSISG
ncbi:HpcH/HpaI aldolase/citrate lyase family protein [Alloalcanivorax sp. C16-2]|uniref:HpcH/HpaI aldolase/citrate lyase family protein n=1 Tax=Alloalcanivorax sp. C16-2 TaxID=3390052 RepID=UPI00397085C7